MKFSLYAFGKLKSNPEHKAISTLCDYYTQRLSTPLSFFEFEVKTSLSSSEQMTKEAELILKKIPDHAFVIALDEHGQNMSSEDFSIKLSQIKFEGTYSEIIFLIGGAFGIAPSLLKRAQLSLSFGKMTWPHLIVRPLLCEQLYRAELIEKGHPYHKKTIV